ncbi:ATP-dependent Clp protease proteolytic subunit [Priestia endophytica]
MLFKFKRKNIINKTKYVTSLIEVAEWELAENRTLRLTGEIGDNVLNIITMIHKFNLEDEGKPIHRRKRIKLYIESMGGKVSRGFHLINEILASKTPIDTYCSSWAYSSGLAIFLAGDRRYIYPFAKLMHHKMFIAVEEDDDEPITPEEQRDLDNMQGIWTAYISERTDIPREDLESIGEDEEWYFDCEEALELGVATHKI